MSTRRIVIGTRSITHPKIHDPEMASKDNHTFLHITGDGRVKYYFSQTIAENCLKKYGGKLYLNWDDPMCDEFFE